MPELPEVETVRRGLQPAMEGACFDAVEVRRPDLRWPLPPDLAARLEGRQVEALRRRAKYLLADVGAADVLVIHLGMSGSVRVAFAEQGGLPGRFHHPRSRDETHDHVVFRMSNGAVVTFNDPRRFGAMLLVPRAALAEHPLLAALGPEPLDDAFDAAALARACAGKKTSLKAALSDQRVVAGLGNIYVCEALHRAGLSPRRGAATLAGARGEPTKRAGALAGAVRAVLEDAIAAGGSSLRDHRRPDGELGYFQHTFRVYDREGRPCPRQGCTGTIRRIVQGGRSSFFCPACQR